MNTLKAPCFPGEDLKSTVTPMKRLGAMKDAGITRVRLLPSGGKGDCPVCRKLAEKVYSIEELPTIPPRGCTCNPSCTLVVLAYI
jgi:hypothetical protein